MRHSGFPLAVETRQSRIWSRAVIYTILIAACLFFIAPLYVMIITSLKSIQEIQQYSLLSLPRDVTVAAWPDAWSSSCAGRLCEGLRPGFLASIIITVPVVVVSVFMGSLNGYALCFWNIRYANLFYATLMLGLIIPVHIYLYPLVKMTSALGLFGTLPGIILLNIAFGIPIMTMLMRNYYALLPKQLVSAALVDGCGFWNTYLYVILPMSKSIVVVAVVMQFTWVWNEYILGLVFAGRDNTPVMVLLMNLVGSGSGEIRYNVEMAAALIAAAVPLLVYFISGRLFARGIVDGAIKG